MRKYQEQVLQAVLDKARNLDRNALIYGNSRAEATKSERMNLVTTFHGNWANTYGISCRGTTKLYGHPCRTRIETELRM